MKKNWRVFWDSGNPLFSENLKLARKLSSETGLSEFLIKLLIVRGIKTKEEIKEFLYPDESSIIDPFLLKDMDKTVDLLIDIKKKKEKLIVYGDYDADGVTAAAVLYQGFKALGWNVEAYIPNRIDEGYSLNVEAIDELYEKGYMNIITVDCGTTSLNEISHAKEKDMKIIITDHHETQQILPNADAIVNPKRKDDDYPFKGLSGVGVAFKVLLAVHKTLKNTTFNPFSLIDLVALGTIADIVPLRSENRFFVKKGLEKLRNNPNPALKYLMKEIGIVPEDVKSYVVAYKIAPKINAAGRMADAMKAFELLMTEENKHLEKKVKQLLDLNSERQKHERRIYKSALSLMDINPDYHDKKVIVLSGKDWHLGVLGIVASKLSNKFNKPVLLVSTTSNDNTGKGSARSPHGISLIELMESLSQKNENFFKEYGGHELAAGFTIDSENIEYLRDEINKMYKKLYGDKEPESEIEIDMEIENLWNSFFDDITLLEPYGYQNPEPTFLIKNVSLERIKIFGAEEENLAAIAKTEKGMIFEVVGYGILSNKKDGMNGNLKCNLVGNFRIERTFYNNQKVLKFYVKDIEFIGDSLTEKGYSGNLLISLHAKDNVHHLTNYKYKILLGMIEENRNAIFAPLKIKNTLLIEKIKNTISKGENLIIIGASHLLLEYTYKIINQYISSENIYYNKKSKIENTILKNKKIILTTVPAYIQNIQRFNDFSKKLLIDEPIYSFSHPTIANIPEYIQLRKVIRSKNYKINLLGTFYDESIKEFLKLSGYRVANVNANVPPFEVVKEINSNKFKLIKDYLYNSKNLNIIVNDITPYVNLKSYISSTYEYSEDYILYYSHMHTFFEKINIRELNKKGPSRILISEFINDGLSLEQKDRNSIIMLYDVPKTRIELLDLVSSWPHNKKDNIVFVMAYNTDFSTKFMYEFSRKYPSPEMLKKVYEIIKENDNININIISEKYFNNDVELIKTIVNELINTGIVIDTSNGLKTMESFRLDLIHKNVKLKESILDKWILKNSIRFFSNFKSRSLISLLNNQIAEVK
ncbi:exonuclease RecJ [Marinitoga hydrogenitolerans DSM 16785]|uniref:Single-stranded-DNA-specific exonuclease RecJ n=1 Tax=Marinitoga hydrogenitolerans (strain DSM 16785 / JCM 12826 / AT1271) TaxID=1122195 RepID=A0A1M5A927_MARH1|nr:single-stranded-DNA-specific exonuclease RecJ [Marinitoga hydrogenitolerans]SHF26759.1 exonuclease RecJ [Marinitoga hydrogenitolerans DSM 16785]